MDDFTKVKEENAFHFGTNRWLEFRNKSTIEE